MGNVRRIIKLGVLVGCLALPASSSAEVLTFDGLASNERLQQYYNGGAGSLGSVGPDYGVVFNTDARALRDSDAGGSGLFANEPSASGVLIFQSASGAAVVNMPDGISDALSLSYSASREASVTVYDGADGTGAILASVTLAENWQDGGCTGDPTGAYCHWDRIDIPFPSDPRTTTDRPTPANGMSIRSQWQ